MALTEDALAEIRALPDRFPELRSAVPPALDIAQEELGYVSPDAIRDVAGALGLDPGYVEGVATFYTLLHLEPVGRHHFYVCTNLSCSLRGAGEIVRHLAGRIGVPGPGRLSDDGHFSFEEVECLGACEFAPMMRYGGRYHYDLTPESVDALVDAARAGTPPPGARPEAPAPARRNPRPRRSDG